MYFVYYVSSVGECSVRFALIIRISIAVLKNFAKKTLLVMKTFYELHVSSPTHKINISVISPKMKLKPTIQSEMNLFRKNAHHLSPIYLLQNG